MKQKNWKLSLYKSICRCWYREAITVVHSLLQTLLLLLLLPDFKSLYQGCHQGWIKNFYHGNCGVIQGFPALRKAVTTYVKKYRIFFTCVDKVNQLLTCHSPLAPLSQLRLMNELQSSQDSQYKMFVGTFSNYGGYTLMAATHSWRLKTHVFEPHWQTMRFKLSWKGTKTNKLKEKPKVTSSVALVLVSRLRIRIDN